MRVQYFFFSLKWILIGSKTPLGVSHWSRSATKWYRWRVHSCYNRFPLKLWLSFLLEHFNKPKSRLLIGGFSTVGLPFVCRRPNHVHFTPNSSTIRTQGFKKCLNKSLTQDFSSIQSYPAGVQTVDLHDTEKGNLDFNWKPSSKNKTVSTRSTWRLISDFISILTRDQFSSNIGNNQP